jgi:hypothetical protein
VPGDHRRECGPERRRDLCLQRQVAHHDRQNTEGDSRPRPRRSGAHPDRDGRRDDRVRVQGRLRRVQAVPADRPAVLLHRRGVIADRLS